MRTRTADYVLLECYGPTIDDGTNASTTHPVSAQVRQAPHSYFAHLFDESSDGDYFVGKVHKHSRMLKGILDDAIEQGEYNKVIRCVDGTSRSPARKGKGEAPSAIIT